MWIDYKGVMKLLDIGRNKAYIIINQLNNEFNEYGIRYSNRHTHSGRVITLHREQQAEVSSA